MFLPKSHLVTPRRIDDDITHRIRPGWVKPSLVPVRRVEALIVDGLGRRGRPKLRWEDKLKHDMNELLFSEDMTSYRNAWRDMIRICG